jgi:4-hydroxy-2-oxoheptanedioate aldolase
MSYNISVARGTSDARSFREIVSGRVVAHGGWCLIPSAFATEIVSASGCDWLCIDTQHGLIDDAAMRVMVQAAAIRCTPVAVRVPWNEPASIMRALDAGADCIIVPMVNTEEDARLAVAASKYPPLGYRSWGPIRSAMARPGFNPSVGNEQTVCIVMIETVEAYENLGAILDVPGVGGVFVGPNDLAISHAGETEGAGRSPKDVEMIERIAKECARRSLTAGIACTNGEDARRWGRAGYTLLALSGDAALIGEGMTALLVSARDTAGPA